MKRLPSPGRGERMRVGAPMDRAGLTEIEPRTSGPEARATPSATMSADINEQCLRHPGSGDPAGAGSPPWRDKPAATETTHANAPFPDRRDYYALAILAAAVVLMFWKVLFTSQMLFYRDILNQSYPLARLIHQICRSGSLPYWNPYLNF